MATGQQGFVAIESGAVGLFQAMRLLTGQYSMKQREAATVERPKRWFRFYSLQQQAPLLLATACGLASTGATWRRAASKASGS